MLARLLTLMQNKLHFYSEYVTMPTSMHLTEFGSFAVAASGATAQAMGNGMQKAMLAKDIDRSLVELISVSKELNKEQKL